MRIETTTHYSAVLPLTQKQHQENSQKDVAEYDIPFTFQLNFCSQNLETSVTSLLKSLTRTILPRRNTAGLCLIGTTGNSEHARYTQQTSISPEFFLCPIMSLFKTTSTRISTGRTKTNARTANPKFLQNSVW